MIQMRTAYTEEFDDIEDGLAEILEQIDVSSLKKNNIGLVTCHFDFITTGFAVELSKKLPFDIVGMTTMASANQHGQGMYALSFTVLTSDDVIFETTMTEPLNSDNYEKELKASYLETVKKLPGNPSLIITFFPYIKDLSGAVMHRTFDAICDGVPFWGGLATDPDVSYVHSNVFLNGGISKNGMVMAMLYGPVDPEFIVVSIPAQNIRKDRGQITDSEGCILKTINGIQAVQYLKNLGIVIMNDASITTPLIIYYQGSTMPVALGIYAVNADGSILCGGDVPKGAAVTLGEITNEGIIATAGESMTRMLECGRRNGALLLPCVSRYVMLVPNHNSELELIAERLENGRVMPYMASYSSGELCPVRDESGILRNRFHNFTFSVCVF